MELLASFLACLSIALCARIVWGNKKLRLIEYELDELREERNTWRMEYWRADGLRLELDKKYNQLANELKASKDALENLSSAQWNEGYERGFACGRETAVFICESYPTSKGSTLAKRILKG